MCACVCVRARAPIAHAQYKEQTENPDPNIAYRFDPIWFMLVQRVLAQTRYAEPRGKNSSIPDVQRHTHERVNRARLVYGACVRHRQKKVYTDVRARAASARANQTKKNGQRFRWNCFDVVRARFYAILEKNCKIIWLNWSLIRLWLPFVLYFRCHSSFTVADTCLRLSVCVCLRIFSHRFVRCFLEGSRKWTLITTKTVFFMYHMVVGVCVRERFLSFRLSLPPSISPRSGLWRKNRDFFASADEVFSFDLEIRRAYEQCAVVIFVWVRCLLNHHRVAIN